MTLDEFLAKMRKDLDTFEEKWRANHENSPCSWPMEMGQTDWEEQFLLFEEEK